MKRSTDKHPHNAKAADSASKGRQQQRIGDKSVFYVAGEVIGRVIGHAIKKRSGKR